MSIKPPAVIWLQFYDEDGEAPNELYNDNVTWAAESINDNDVRYIRDKRQPGEKMEAVCASCDVTFDRRFWSIDRFKFCPGCGKEWKAK